MKGHDFFYTAYISQLIFSCPRGGERDGNRRGIGRERGENRGKRRRKQGGNRTECAEKKRGKKGNAKKRIANIALSILFSYIRRRKRNDEIKR